MPSDTQKVASFNENPQIKENFQKQRYSSRIFNAIPSPFPRQSQNSAHLPGAIHRDYQEDAYLFS